MLGWDVHLLHDVHHRLTPIEAARLGKDLEPYRLFWLEDAVAAENQANFRLIRQHTTTPLAVGEVFNSIWDCKQLIEEQLIDYIRATVVHAGGITHLRRIAALADLYNVRTGCHGATDLSPVDHGGGAAFRRLDPEFRHPGMDASRARKPTRSSRTAISIATARCIRAKRRAWAWTSTKRSPRKYPYKRAYLPVNRLEDGSMHDW